MRVGLYGILGVYNFGCEAIIRGACNLIKKIYPDSEIIYFSYSYEYDTIHLSDLPIKIYEVKVSNNILKRAVNSLLRRVNSEKRILMMNFKAIMDEVDVIFSIGGDIYTIPEVIRRKNTYPYYNNLVDFCNHAINEGKEVFLYGASVGPFGEYKKAVNYYKKNLSRYTKIVCREYVTMDYLKNIGLNNIMFLPDPALQVRGKDNSQIPSKYIGINLSPLSLNELYGSYDDNSVKALAHLLSQIYDRFKMDLLFIPHVISKDENDNDLLFMQQVLKFIDGALVSHIKIADYNSGFLGLKNQLRECHLVVSARMHCAINAIDEGVPAIFLTYSQKSIGMCEYIYGTDKWTVDMKKAETELIHKIDDMMNQENDIAEYIRHRNIEIQQYFEENCCKIPD